MSTKTVPKKKKAKQKRSLQAVVQRLIEAGVALSNLAFNLKQRKDLSPELTATLEEWQEKWDAARTEMLKRHMDKVRWERISDDAT